MSTSHHAAGEEIKIWRGTNTLLYQPPSAPPQALSAEVNDSPTLTGGRLTFTRRAAINTLLGHRGSLEFLLLLFLFFVFLLPFLSFSLHLIWRRIMLFFLLFFSCIFHFPSSFSSSLSPSLLLSSFYFIFPYFYFTLSLVYSFSSTIPSPFPVSALFLLLLLLHLHSLLPFS